MTTQWPWMRNGHQRQMTDVEKQFIVKEMLHNATTQRAHFLSDLFDDRRSIEDECGWPPSDTSIDVEVYRQLYDRDPLACRVVQLMPKESWQLQPSVYEDESSEDETEFEQAWDELSQQLSSQGGNGTSFYQDEHGGSLWGYLQRADELSGIGHFGVLLLGIDDARNLQEPVDGVMVINKRKAVPILKDVPVRNARGERTGTRKKQVGTKISWDKVPAMPDSPLHPNELAAITDPKPRRVWVGNQKDKASHSSIPVYREVAAQPLSSEEQAVVANWKAEADQIQQWQKDGQRIVANQGRWVAESPVDNAVIVDGKKVTSRKGDTSKLSPGMQPSTPGQSSGAMPSPFVLGSDKQYDQSFSQTWAPGTQPFGASVGFPPQGVMATPGSKSSESTGDKGSDFGGSKAVMPGSSLSGTDQQYFGVQYGPSEALDDKPTKKQHKLLFLRAFDESLVQVVRYEWNIRNPRFGLPVMYRITLNDPREQHSGIGLPLATVFVHWSRVIHLADNLKSSEIFGVPRMRPVLNAILDARKVRGGSAEGYWKAGCMPTVSFETNPAMGGDIEIDQQKVLDMWEQVQNGLQKAMTLEGIQAKTLPPQVVDPTPYHAMQKEVICIQLACPIRVFNGAERGELASSQDDEDWNERVVARRHGYLTPRVICPLVDRLILLAVLPEPDGYSVEWPDPDALSETDKSTICLTNTQALSAYVAGNCETVLPPKDFMTNPKFLGMEEEEAEAILDDASKAHEDQETMTMPPQVAGHDQPPPEGSQAADDLEQQKVDKANQLDAFKQAAAKGGPPGAAAGPPAVPSPAGAKGGPPPPPAAAPPKPIQPTAKPPSKPPTGGVK